MNHKPVVLYRAYEFEYEREELDAMKANFDCFSLRTEIPSNSLVIGRYSVLPYYKELEDDLGVNQTKLINSYAQHSFLANMRSWYEKLAKFTPRTWFSVSEMSFVEEGPFVLKGHTNSRKSLWSTHMFAETRGDIGRVIANLNSDGLIASQDICIRKFVPLKTYFIGLNGMPVTNEHRFFFYKNKVLSSGFYWSSYIADFEDIPSSDEVPRELIQQVADIVAPHSTFWVGDFAQTADGEWILIELNDAQMSGLSENNPNTLFSNLKTALIEDK